MKVLLIAISIGVLSYSGAANSQDRLINDNNYKEIMNHVFAALHQPTLREIATGLEILVADGSIADRSATHADGVVTNEIGTLIEKTSSVDVSTLQGKSSFSNMRYRIECQGGGQMDVYRTDRPHISTIDFNDCQIEGLQLTGRYYQDVEDSHRTDIYFKNLNIINALGQSTLLTGWRKVDSNRTFANLVLTADWTEGKGILVDGGFSFGSHGALNITVEDGSSILVSANRSDKKSYSVFVNGSDKAVVFSFL